MPLDRLVTLSLAAGLLLGGPASVSAGNNGGTTLDGDAQRTGPRNMVLAEENFEYSTRHIVQTQPVDETIAETQANPLIWDDSGVDDGDSGQSTKLKAKTEYSDQHATVGGVGDTISNTMNHELDVSNLPKVKTGETLQVLGPNSTPGGAELAAVTLPPVLAPEFTGVFTAPAKRISFAVENGNFKAANLEAERVIADEPEAPEGYWLSGWVRSQAGERERALEIVRTGLDRVPQERSESLQTLEKLLKPKASEMAQKEVDRRKNALLGRLTGDDAAADFGAGFAGRAVAAAEQAPQMAGMVNPAMFSQAARQAPASAPDPRALAGIQGGLSALRVGDAKAAVSHFTEAIRREPENPVGYRFRAMALHRAGANELAVKDANRAIALDPADHWAFLVRAKALTELKQYEAAQIDIQAALELNPKSADAYATRARLHHVKGEHKQELQDYRTAVNLDPAFADLFRGAMREAERLSGKSASPSGMKALPKNLLYGGAGLLGLLFFAAGLLRRRGNTTITRSAAQGVAGFDIVRRIGRGGMGEVWEGLDRALERRVAIKKLVPEIASVPRERQRFLKEARTVAALKHPNIIEIHQVVENEDDLYLVFEFVDGVSLDSVLADKGRLSMPETLEVLRQSALALDFAHARGVIHQDLKPANIMVEGETVKVMDFGIARRVAETMGAVTRVEVVGTPSYMAPEQALAQASPETDVFALGATLYEMLSGKRPFGGAMHDFSKLEKAFAPLSRVVPDIPEAVDAVIAKALDPDPKLRYHSAGELFSALEAAARAPFPRA